MRSILCSLLCALAGTAGAATYACPEPVSTSVAGCTLRSTGGTTTFTVNAWAQALGTVNAGSAMAMAMSVDGIPCNSNNSVPIPINNSAIVSGTCTFEVTSKWPVEFLAVSQSVNATPMYIRVEAASVSFVPDYVLSVSASGNGTVRSTDANIDCGADCSESYAPGSTVTLTATGSAGWAFSHWSGDCAGTAPTCTVAMTAAKAVQATFMVELAPPVIEFYNSVSDHYFVTGDPTEIAGIEQGRAGAGWVRTGLSFKPGGNAPVCRFYGSASPGPNSHFYTGEPDECAFLRQLQAATPASQPRWNFEGVAFNTILPSRGSCPVGMIPVYRAYNDGAALHKDGNHRLSTRIESIQDVMARGWKYEGVVMCAQE